MTGPDRWGQYVYPIGSNDTFQVLTKQTDSKFGKLRFRYVASQFGGVERITAKLLSDTTSRDTVSLWTVVKGLERLRDTTWYNLIGGTCNHRGPRDDQNYLSCRIPDNNHFGARVIRDSLVALSKIWVDSLRQDTLFVNDMSLPYGGLFDVDGVWRPEHAEHREGKDADLRTAIPSGPNARRGIKVRNAAGETIDNTKFESQAKRFGAKAKIHKRQSVYEHYHLDYR